MIDPALESTRLRGLVKRTLAEQISKAPDADDGDGQSSFLHAAVAVVGQCDRLFALPCVDAPGLHLIGSEIKLRSPDNTAVVSATGKGLTEIDALVSCLGEAAEYLSLHQAIDHLPSRSGTVPEDAKPSADALAELRAMVGSGIDISDQWIPATSLLAGKEVWIPATLGSRDRIPNYQPPVPPSTGCAVSDNMQRAQLHGLLEVIERDAVALWWLGGQPATELPVELPDRYDVREFLQQLRQGSVNKTTWWMNITTDIGVPCVVALSCDDNGRGLACGFGAGLTWQAAIEAATLEMCQIEMAVQIVKLKYKQRGADGLNDADKTHLKRVALDVSSLPLLAPTVWDDRAIDEIHETTDVDDTLRVIVKRVQNVGVEPLYVNLTSEGLPGVAACRVLTPGLQPLNPSIRSKRLESLIEATGGGAGVLGSHALV